MRVIDLFQEVCASDKISHFCAFLKNKKSNNQVSLVTLLA